LKPKSEVMKSVGVVLSRGAEQRAAVVVAQLERMRPEAFAHSRRVANLSVRVARHAKLPAAMVSEIYWGGLVHDIGELDVRRSVLDKPTSLDDQERLHMSEHAEVGARWLASIPGLAPLVPYARWHHERFDGGGYPDGVGSRVVPMSVALVGVCDAWDAMTQPRPYREPLRVAEAIAEMERNAGRQWSRALVQWTLDCVGALARNHGDDALGSASLDG
jgi:HD-GYP domain-containing protein (c-di-GMP phosphodiesterase class II)